jgi:hypothetical protein
VHGNGAVGIEVMDNSVPVTVTNNVIVSNQDKGIMVGNDVQDLTVINNTIASNRNEGILAWGNITVTHLRNNIIALNGYCGIAAAQGAEYPDIDHNDVWLNGGGGGNYCDYGGAVIPPVPGSNDISTDPLFVDSINGDYHLKTDSPCIDTGSDIEGPLIDFEGDQRPFDGNFDGIPLFDIGADEYQSYQVYLPGILKNYSVGPATPNCSHLVGTGDTIRVAIVPSGFDGTEHSDVVKFNGLAWDIAAGFSSIEPYASNLDRISLFRADDYRGVGVTDDNIWYNADLIAAADVCDWNQIIVIANNSGWAGGAPGFFSVVGSGTPPTCDPFTCTGESCPWTPTCSWDESVGYTALHETGHTFAGLRHTCTPASPELKWLESFERVSLSLDTADDPINCGVQFPGSELQPCMEWNNENFLIWDYPEDPNFGCYVGCGDRWDWYRPWQTNINMMCRDDYFVNGFTPVDRKILNDVLNP